MSHTEPNLNIRQVFRVWWPLALSWLLMSIEGPAQSAIVARLADPTINLAAWGGIVYPLAFLIEAPIIMLLSASTALCKDWDAYVKIRRFMMITGAALTGLHALIAFTPLYDFVALRVIGAPADILEPGRIGLMIMLPWTWSIAYRRFQQGVMIRFGQARAVTAGTVIRLAANGVVLLIGYLLQVQPGIIVGAGAIASGVFAEAVYAGVRVRPILRDQLRLAPRSAVPLTLRDFLVFYVPLALTSLISMLVSPIGSAAISRMPHALESLAAWPVVSGTLFLLRSGGVAYKEVVIASLDAPAARRVLRRFTALLIAASTVFLLLVAVTPLSTVWFVQIMALAPDLAAMGRLALLLGVAFPTVATLDSWFQGQLLHARRTRSITAAVVLYILAIGAGMTLGVVTALAPGIYVAVVVLQFAWAAQVAWLWHQNRQS